jgi:hypothetical protein
VAKSTTPTASGGTPLHVAAGRFVSGRPLDGRLRSDATFLRAGSRPLTRTGHASAWAMRPGWHRAAWRVGITTGTLAGLVGWVTHPLLTAVLGCLAGAGGMAWAAWRVDRAVRRFRHHRTWVRPLHKALAGRVGVPLAAAPSSWLTVPMGYSADDAEIRVSLPHSFGGTAEERRVVRETVASKLAMSDLDAEFRLSGRSPVAVFRAAPRPPDRVNFASARAAMGAAPDSAPLLGIARRDKAVSVDLDAESPHILVSAGTGGGKSVILRLILAQGLHRGAFGVVCDIKRHSHRWARGLSAVDYHRDVESIHDALIALAAEGERRNRIVDATADDQVPDVGPRIFVLMEEMNATISRLQKHWDSIRDRGDSRRSPAVDAFGELLFMGRAVRIHVVAVAQMATARALGGPEIRENFATRILGRYSRNAWAMLAPEVWPPPQSSRHAGRVQVVLAGTANETQIVYLTEAEARVYATNGAPGPATRPMAQVDISPPRQGGTVPALRIVSSDHGAPIGLGEAVRSGVLTVSLESARAARKRDSEFPAAAGQRGQELLYAPEELRRWERNRPRAGDVDKIDAVGQ